MSKLANHSLLLAKYLAKFQENPRSKVFAPLAETYRKLGMLEDAFAVLKRGIKYNPDYTLGYVVLGNCFFDNGEFETSYNTLRPHIKKNRDNITLQKLFARTCINLGQLDEALETYKYLLLMNPKDSDVAEQVKVLEDDLTVRESSMHVQESPVKGESYDDDSWVEVNFDQYIKVAKPEDVINKFKEDLSSEHLKIPERNLDDTFYKEEYDFEGEDVVVDIKTKSENEVKDDRNIMTYTLVDLYVKQGFPHKAIEVLEKILENNPQDFIARGRLDELQNISHLTSNVSNESKLSQVKEKYNLFLESIRSKSEVINQ
jgi:tetratricopeptide (TPR) repeat protein